MPADGTVPEPTGSLITKLACSNPSGQRTATLGLLSLAKSAEGPEAEFPDGLRTVIQAEWTAVRASREGLVAPLVAAFASRKVDLLTLEVIAIALALQGEDGVTELVPYLADDDFVLRDKAAIGIGVLDRSARWAVPALLRALRSEPQPLVVYNILGTLGRIGGAEARRALEQLYAHHRRPTSPDHELLQVLERALAFARLQ